MKKRFWLYALLSLLVLCLSCGQLFGGAEPSPSPSSLPALSWTEVGSATGPAFQNGWASVGGLYQTCSYALDVQGQLHIVGIIADSSPSGGSGEVIFQLPAAFLPTSVQRATVTGMGAGFSGSAIATLSVEPDGDVWVYPSGAATDDMMDLGHAVVRLR